MRFTYVPDRSFRVAMNRSPEIAAARSSLASGLWAMHRDNPIAARAVFRAMQRAKQAIVRDVFSNGTGGEGLWDLLK